MFYTKQFGIILLFSFVGELLNRLLPLPVPAAIYGLVLMLFALRFRIIRLEQVQETGTFLISAMALMFIPPAVALMAAWSSLREILLPVAVITVSSTLLVMIVTGRVTQFMIRWEGKKRP